MRRVGFLFITGSFKTRGLNFFHRTLKSERARTPVVPRSSDVLKAQTFSKCF
ncbi:hypothetical protein HMPREF9554_02049 [Treponema phagedenis F0421]|nr:hypothetical protein HMPREF9554_02049 [Treponema phagedenis F0421]